MELIGDLQTLCLKSQHLETAVLDWVHIDVKEFSQDIREVMESEGIN